MTCPPCPCCTHLGTTACTASDTEFSCPLCGHQWRLNTLPDDYYQGKKHRNPETCTHPNRKLADRVQSITPLLRDGMRILEIGCAEGRLGAAVKRLSRIEYVGIEISEDADQAATRLDCVVRQPASGYTAPDFDLLLSFHVLEHIVDIKAEISHWSRLLKPEGILILEVPNQAGHPLLSRDSNPEHLHFFSSASLLTVLHRCGMEAIQLSRGHFESPVYSDGLRVIARKSMDDTTRRTRLIQRFMQKMGGEFVVFGAGGDFRNYVAPVLDDLPVVSLCDSDPALKGQTVGKQTICAYDPVSNAKHPVLIASLRFKAEISEKLLALGVPACSIFGLDDIYGEQA